MTAIGAVADWQLAASAVMTVNDRHWVANGRAASGQNREIAAVRLALSN